MRIEEILKVTEGSLISGGRSASIDAASISTDSRTIKKGEFFLPLKGDRFDGERFVAEALSRGAKGAFVTRPQGHKATRSQEKIIIKVKDTVKALQEIAHYHRMKFNIPIIGITGSNGKTTTKDMMAQIFSQRFNVLKSEGTKNNHIGVPQTLLKMNNRHDICILEFGANHRGEIRLLADMARPDLAVITNIGPSHLKFLRDLKGVFLTKKEIIGFFGRKNVLIVNGDDEYLSGIGKRCFRIIRFGFNERNDLRASLTSVGFGRIEFILNDKWPFKLNILGTHNVYNALAAIAAARHYKLGMESIKKGLAGYSPTHMRLNIKNIGGITVVNDAYNSNPSSMKCAIVTMKDMPAKAKWIVSADMLELGEREDYFHMAIGEYIARSGFNGLLTLGRLSVATHRRAIECGMSKENAWHCSTHEQVADILSRVVKRGDVVLIKGSRAMKMEEVIKKLKVFRV